MIYYVVRCFAACNSAGSMHKPLNRIAQKYQISPIQRSFKDRVKTLRERCERHVLIYFSKESKKILAIFSLYDNVLVLTNNTQGVTMRFSTAKTRYKAQKENPDCFSFYRVEGGYVCFYCAQALRQYIQQR